MALIIKSISFQIQKKALDEVNLRKKASNISANPTILSFLRRKWVVIRRRTFAQCKSGRSNFYPFYITITSFSHWCFTILIRKMSVLVSTQHSHLVDKIFEGRQLSRHSIVNCLTVCSDCRTTKKAEGDLPRENNACTSAIAEIYFTVAVLQMKQKKQCKSSSFATTKELLDIKIEKLLEFLHEKHVSYMDQDVPIKRLQIMEKILSARAMD